jgi:glutaredoxin 2
MKILTYPLTHTLPKVIPVVFGEFKTPTPSLYFILKKLPSISSFSQNLFAHKVSISLAKQNTA